MRRSLATRPNLPAQPGFSITDHDLPSLTRPLQSRGHFGQLESAQAWPRLARKGKQTNETSQEAGTARSFLLKTSSIFLVETVRSFVLNGSIFRL